MESSQEPVQIIPDIGCPTCRGSEGLRSFFEMDVPEPGKKCFCGASLLAVYYAMILVKEDYREACRVWRSQQQR